MACGDRLIIINTAFNMLSAMVIHAIALNMLKAVLIINRSPQALNLVQNDNFSILRLV